MVLGYLTSTNLPRVDRLSTDPRDLGRLTIGVTNASFASPIISCNMKNNGRK